MSAGVPSAPLREEGCDVVSNSSASVTWIRFAGMISADARTPFENGLILLTFCEQYQPKAADGVNKEALC
ncbi:hypothetical protein GCM10027295_37590 [Pseudaeromonas pectinilytica]